MAEDDFVKLEVVDLSTFKIEGETLNMDLTEDAWIFGGPPPKDYYSVKCFLAKDGTKMGLMDKNNPKSVYFYISIECVIQGGDYDKATLFGGLSTRVYRGKHISTAAAFIKLVGGEKFLNGGKLNHLQLATLCEKILKKEPVIKALVDWRGSYKWTDEKGEDHWENSHNKYEDFPVGDKKGDIRKHHTKFVGKFKHEYDVNAQAKIAKFFGTKEVLPPLGDVHSDKLVSQPKSVAQPVNVGGVNIAPASKVQPAETVEVDTSNDEELMLEA